MSSKANIHFPLISIITVVFNDVNNIEKTIQSVLNQKFNSFEYIIIDGSSTDGTVDVIKKYQGNITNWVSEKDNGIYDAMNKGIRMTSGIWINFMNSGDIFYNDTVLTDIFDKKNYDSASVVYGNTIIKFHNRTVKTYPHLLSQELKALNISHIRENFEVFYHQSSFVRTYLLKQMEFDTRYNLRADFNFFVQLHTLKKEFIKIDNFISIYDGNGASSVNTPIIRKETLLILNINSKKDLMNRFLFLLKFNLKQKVKEFILLFKGKFLEKNC